jgi:hypothetical protein
VPVRYDTGWNPEQVCPLFAVGKNQLPLPVFEPWIYENLDMLGIIQNMVESMHLIKVAQNEAYSQGL